MFRRAFLSTALAAAACLATAGPASAGFSLSITGPAGFTPTIIGLGPDAFFTTTLASVSSFNAVSTTSPVAGGGTMITTGFSIKQGAFTPSGFYTLTLENDAVAAAGPGTLTSILTSVIADPNTPGVNSVNLTTSVVGGNGVGIAGNATTTTTGSIASGPLPGSPFTLQSKIVLSLGAGQTGGFTAISEFSGPPVSAVPVPPTALAAAALPLFGLARRLRRRAAAAA